MRMNVTRRTFLGGATALAGAAALGGLAFAETYPSKPISYIVPYNRAAQATSSRGSASGSGSANTRQIPVSTLSCRT